MLFRSITAPTLATLVLFAPVVSHAAQDATPEQLYQYYLDLALKRDPWQTASAYREQGLRARGEAADALPDPRVSVNLANIPLDTFALNQEAMTQLSVGVTQMLPRGDSLVIAANTLSAEADAEPSRRLERQAQIAKTFALKWIAALQANYSASQIRNETHLFTQLSDIVQANYEVVANDTSQYDVISAEVMLAELDDRLNRLDIAGTNAITSLAALLPQAQQWQLAELSFNGDVLPWLRKYSQLPASLPSTAELKLESTYSHLMAHPTVTVKQQAIEVSDWQRKQVEQSFEPQWGVSASYALRQDAPNGQDRANFFSVGINVDVPLFSRDTRDPQLSAAKAKTESLKTNVRLTVQQMHGELLNALLQWQQLDQRRERFESTIIPLRTQHSEAAINAYTRDSAPFKDVLESKIKLLEAKLSLADILAQMASLSVQTRYLWQPISLTQQDVQ